MTDSREMRKQRLGSDTRGRIKSITKFEDLIAWQKARQLTRQIYSITSKSDFSKDFGLRDQIRRAAISVMSNIAEGYDRRGLAEFQHFLGIAKGSCAEVKSQLYVATDVGYLTDASFQNLMNLADETSRVVGALRSSVQRKRSPAP